MWAQDRPKRRILGSPDKVGHNVQASAEYIMKTEQLSGASSDNRARTKWWIFPSEVVWRREGRWVPIEANGNGVECFVPPCAPPPPPTSPLCPHPHILIHSASPSTLPATTPQSIGFVLHCVRPGSMRNAKQKQILADGRIQGC